jgi:hypothetical protein
MYGPWGCPACGWSACSEYDKTLLEHQPVKDGRYRDQFGGEHSVERIVENASRFGLGEAAKQAFSDDVDLGECE